MAAYLVSVELRAGEGGEGALDRLKLEMRRAGFSGTIKREDGTRFRLPATLFRFAGDEGASLEFVRNLATSVARQVHDEAAVLAVEARAWTEAGLKVKPS